MYQVNLKMIQEFFYNKMSLVWQGGIQIHNKASSARKNYMINACIDRAD